MKRWIVGAVLLLLVAALLLPQAALSTHGLLSGEKELLTANPWQAWPAVLDNAKALQFYLIYLALVVLIIGWILVSSTYLAYRSDMQRITPDIRTPAPAGQGQFGTARWMEPKQISRNFGIWKVPKHNRTFRRLMDAGKDSYKEVERANVRLD